MEVLSLNSFRLGSKTRSDIKRRKNVKNIICHQGICFLLTDSKVLVRTRLQTFLIEPVEVPGNLWQRRVNKIRAMIVKRQITDYEALLAECGRGVLLLPVNLDWYI